MSRVEFQIFLRLLTVMMMSHYLFHEYQPEAKGMKVKVKKYIQYKCLYTRRGSNEI